MDRASVSVTFMETSLGVEQAWLPSALRALMGARRMDSEFLLSGMSVPGCLFRI